MRENLMQKVAEVAPDHYLFLERTAEEIRNSPFRDEIVSEMNEIIKTAEQMAEKTAFSLSGFGRGIRNAASDMAANPAARYIGATVAGGVALSLAGDLYEAARRGLTKSRHWTSMLEQNPDLSTRAKTDPQVKVMFDTLHRFNPEFAADPHVAANFVNAQLEFPTDIGIPQQLVKSRSDIRNSSGLRAIPGMPQPKTKADLTEQQLRMEGQRSQIEGQGVQREKNMLDMDKIRHEMDPDKMEREKAYQEAQMQNQKAQAFKNRQEAMQAYNQRMGMSGPPHKRDRK